MITSDNIEEYVVEYMLQNSIYGDCKHIQNIIIGEIELYMKDEGEIRIFEILYPEQTFIGKTAAYIYYMNIIGYSNVDCTIQHGVATIHGSKKDNIDLHEVETQCNKMLDKVAAKATILEEKKKPVKRGNIHRIFDDKCFRDRAYPEVIMDAVIVKPRHLSLVVNHGKLIEHAKEQRHSNISTNR